MRPDRRRLVAALAAGPGLLAGCAVPVPASPPAAPVPPPAPPRPFMIGSPGQALMPRGSAPRVVVCGGGWGGLMAAKTLRQQAPQAEVVLLERNPVFFSCPISNKWLVDMVDDSFITHDYLAVSQRHGYLYVQCSVTRVDRAARRVHTSEGWLDYDYLVLAPGIRYHYEAWFGNDRRAIDATRARFPAAYVPNAEHHTLKRALKAFRGGDWVMTLPPPPQRCPPSPYERACMVAWWFKSQGIKGRVTILDHKPRPMPIGPGFQAAFNELYKDQITYVPNAQVQEIDPFAKRIRTSAGDLRFDHAVLMAPHQAGDLAWHADAIGRDAQGRPSGWVDVDPLKLHLKGDDRVYAIGDAVGVVAPSFRFYPKSGHVAHAHGRIVGGYIAQRLAGREPAVVLPDNLCYMMVNGSPREAISVQFDYRLNAVDEIEQTQIDDNDRRASLVAENFRWAGLKFGDLFG
ncbi:NAD(P)/FAD-dependent oxidoreductase [Piscinibacter sakaiensis]|uniref:Sulfide dehydrogenase [flavocytochrome C] flavoprotein chain n=1 Tax=Piscinibacter sakaiensis TaxID=1547922 RepID=A0A0K8NTM4_PISS1|nr:FAD/NAD(P)-binding oxidoreductase [Piscinibacter sakaiensis]GAP33732.1 sulfide dehydrogenase [flavocytochrome C] flavoprotein chain precursor [Piscinibacter sakaiensis]